ncbi:TPA: DUF551 domain-containing protein [Klebsiella michiganensis]
MTKSTITREESVQAVFDLKVGYTLELADIEILKRVARMALAMLQAEPVKTANKLGNSPVIPEGWTGNDKANAALMMLDRIETVDSVDDDRIDGIKRIVRELAAAPTGIPIISNTWIPVSERTPGSQEWVIVFAKWANQQVLCWDDVQNRWTDFEDQSYYADMFTHWMPLPAAPQEVSDA